MTRSWMLHSTVALALILVSQGGAQAGNEGEADAAKPRTEANVMDFGASGDGKTDDTAAIQRAVDAGLGAVRLLKGRYRVTSPVVIELDKTGYCSVLGDGVAEVVMAGAGPAFRFVGTHFSSADPGGFEGKVWARQRMPVIDGVGFRGEHEAAMAIEAVGTMQLTITRVHVRGMLHGIHLVENNRNLIVSNCHIYENKGIGIFYDDVNLHQSNIANCHISYNAGGGIVSRGGNVRNIHITGCDIESNMSPDTPATANVLIDCTDSPFGTGEVAITGCTIQHNNPSPNSANIRILGGSLPTADGQRVREGNVTISGNVLSDVQVNVHLKACRGVTLSGNTFWMGYKHNLLVEDCSSVVLGANNFDRNPRYAYGNTQDANNSLVFRDSEDCVLNALHVTNVWRDPAGVTVEKCRRFNITNCTILDCDHVGLLLKQVTHSRVSGCLIRDDRKGSDSVSLKIVGGEGNLVVDNLLGGPAED